MCKYSKLLDNHVYSFSWLDPFRVSISIVLIVKKMSLATYFKIDNFLNMDSVNHRLHTHEASVCVSVSAHGTECCVNISDSFQLTNQANLSIDCTLYCGNL